MYESYKVLVITVGVYHYLVIDLLDLGFESLGL